MIEINLLPAEFRKKEKKDKKDSKMPELPYLRMFIIFFIGLVAVEVLLFFFLLYQGQRSKELHMEAKHLAPDFERIKKIKLDTARTEAMQARLTELTTQPFHWTMLLAAISESVTEDIWLTSVETQKKIVLFDMPKPKEKKEKKEKGKAADAKGKEKSAPEEKPRQRAATRQAKGKRNEHMLIIRGSAPATSEGTGSIGVFIQSLKDNELIKSIVTKAKLETIDRVIVDEEAGTELFNFSVTCLLKDPLGEPNDPV